MAPPGITASLLDLVDYLDEYLRIKDIPDEPNAVNGLQVENSGRVGGIVAAVDASQATIDGVIAILEPGQPPPLVLVHHGLLWDGNVPVAHDCARPNLDTERQQST